MLYTELAVRQRSWCTYDRQAACAEDTEVQIGTLNPGLGVLQPSATQLFKEDFRGSQVINGTVEGLTLKVGRIDRVRQRDFTDYQGVGIAYSGGQYPRTDDRDFHFVAADYALAKNITLSYRVGELSDVYRQHFLGLKAKVAAGPGRFVRDIWLFSFSETGSGEAGRVDNLVYSGLLGYE